MTDTTLSLYIHWPFCASKCPYCDFNSHVRESIDQGRWRDALLRELDAVAEETGGRKVPSLFFGGGTPSLMDPATVAAIIDRAARLWSLAADVEITLEANPTSVETEKLAEYRGAGVNRVSLGVQALDDTALQFLGRGHDAAEATAAVKQAQALFDRVSFDMIYGRPGQSVESWRSELRQALDFAGEHLSLYQLTIEPGTSFYRRATGGETLTAPEEQGAELYEATQAELEAAGLPAYEISNHARPGAECRHNLTYWRYQDYAGIGPGAHGRLTLDRVKWATQRIRSPDRWLDAVETLGDGEEERLRLMAEERLAELVMMGLRLSEGVSDRRLRQEAGNETEYPIDPGRRAALVGEGYLDPDPLVLRATPAGRQRLDAVIAHLLV